MSMRHHAAWLAVLGIGVAAALPFARKQSELATTSVIPESQNIASDAALFLPPQTAVLEVGWEKSPVNSTVQMLEASQTITPPLIQIPELALEKSQPVVLNNTPPPALPVEIPVFNTVSLQSKATKILREPIEPIVPKTKLHKVVDGDTLRTLSLRYFGTEERADAILAANQPLLSDSSLLPVGQELVIPLP
jgi:nucleoid-associated protein YgaU